MMCCPAIPHEAQVHVHVQVQVQGAQRRSFWWPFWHFGHGIAYAAHKSVNESRCHLPALSLNAIPSCVGCSLVLPL